MKTYPLALFLIIPVHLFSQCILNIGSADENCLGNNPALLELVLENSGDNLNWSYSSSPEGLNATISEFSFINSALIEFNQEGVYTITVTDGQNCNKTFEYSVYEPIGFETNINQSEYLLCNNETELQFEIIGNVVNQSWYSTYNSNGQVVISTSTNYEITFQEEAQFTLTVEADDENGCRSRVEQEISVTEGPSIENTTIQITNNSNDCVLNSTDYLLEFDVFSQLTENPTAIINFTPSQYNVVTTNNTETNAETFPINFEIEFENDCIIETTFEYSHNVYSKPEFEIDLNGTLCNEQAITLTNTSPNFNENTEDFFSWEIEGVDNLNGETITFNYEEDGMYTWVLNYNDPNGCSGQFDTTIAVNIESINAGFELTGPSVICEDTGNISFENTSSSNNGNLNYLWSIDNGNTALLSSTQENPNFELYVGSWNLELIVSSVNCADTLTSENVITLIDQPKFEVDFDGVLCNQEVITLSNTSANYNENTAEFFSWNIEGVENLNGETISFSYDQDGEYTWVLEYNNPNGCSAQYDTTVNVNVDYINPVLSTENNQLSCSLNTTLDLAHQTQLGADPLDLYEFEWNLTPNSLEYDASSNLTSSAENATFIISSTQAQNYSLSLEIVNVNTSCSGVKTVANYFSLGGIIADITPNTIKLCETENLSLNTSSIVQAEQVNQYNYNWTLRYLDGTPEIIEVSNLFNSTFILEELGLYQITLEISDENCSSGELSANAMVYPKPVIEATILDTTICTLPYQTNYAVNNNSPEFGSDIYQWNLYSNNDLLYEIENAENLNFSYIIEESNAYQLDLIVINETSLCSSSQSIELNVESVNNEIFSQDTTSCSSSTIVNVSTNNTELFIQNYDWIFTDNQGETTNVNNQQEVFINLEPGVYDVNLQTETYNGCQSSVSKTDYLTINSFDAVINQIPDSICFQGNNETTQTFTSSINSELNTAYELVNYSWEITSSSSQAPLKLSSDFENVQYQFYLPGVYTITFSAEIFGSGGNCSVLAQDEFNVGVDASIQFEDQICLGETFSIEAIELDLWSQTHDFNWQTDQPNSITIDNPNNLTAQISTDLTEQVLDSIVNITLTTTNNVGCWQTKSKEIEIYKIDANFEVSDSILHCSDQQITLNSTNNQYIDSWEWTIYEPNNNFTTYQDYSDEFQNHSFNNAGYSSIELNITSKHGCIDQFVQDSVVLLNGYNVEILSDSIFCLNDQAEIENTFYAQITPLFPIDSIASLFQANWNISPTNGTVLNSFENNIDSVSYLFNQSNSYDLFYNISFENQNCEIQKNFNIDIGVSVAIQDPITICVGNEHTVNSEVDTWSENHAYEWYTSSSELQITNPTSSSVSIETFNEIETGEITNYDLSLIVTNDANCIDTVTSIVQAYQVKADIQIADTLLNCTDQNVLLSSLNNQYINSWNWIINEPNQPEENVSLTDSTYTHTFSNPGVSLINLEISSVHGCSDQTLLADTLFLNTFEVLIDEVPDSICFQGALQTTQVFNATITSNTLGLPYESTNFNWEIISNNSSSASLLNQSLNQAEFEFTNSGVYTLVYWTTINGTDLSSDCLYSDTVVFNVGVDVSIMYDEIICVGKQFNAQAVDLDPWSQSHLFNWSTDQNELLIQNPNENETTLSTETELGANNSEIFDISLQVTNTVGCWEIESETIEAYQVVADMLIADTLLFCPNQSVQLSSLNNQYINSWSWTSTEENYNFNEPLISSLVGQQSSLNLNSVGIYDVSLVVSSSHGCSDSISIDSAIVINDLNPVLLDIDSILCFNGATELDKQFQINYNSIYEVPITISEFEWNTSPEVEIIEENSIGLSVKFNEPNNYSISYTIEIDNGTANSCFYSDEIEFDIGVNASIDIPETICVGNSFEMSAEVSIGIGDQTTYNWLADSYTFIAYPNATQTNITSESDFLTGDQISNHPIEFTVVNDNGCFIKIQDSIKVYNIVADIISDETGELCAPVQLAFESLYTNYVESYQWGYYKEDYFGDDEYYLSTLDTSIFVLQANDMAIYDIGLSVLSEHGCVDTIFYNDLISVKKPYPNFSTNNNSICDGELLDINDESSLTTNVFLTYGTVYIDSLLYNVNETNQIQMSFPYGETEELVYSEKVTLYGFLDECTSSFYDTVQIYPNPNIKIEYSDTAGCSPHQIDFSDFTTYILSDSATYFWDFGDGVTSEAKNPQHTYTIPGLYQVFHSVTSKNGCYSDTLISTLFEIYENPTASLSFTITNDAFCYGQAEVQFENTSTYTTDSILSSWTFNLDTNSNYTDFEPSIVFNASGEVEINLEVTDLRGCFDDTIALINIDILDTLVNLPLIKYVTVNELGVQVVWGEETQDDYFKNIILAHKENQDWVQIFNSSDEFLNTYNHTISTSQINNYVILQQDSCTYYSDSSIMHSTIHLTVESNEYETLELTWSNYKGWEEVDYYSIYRSTNNLEFDEIDTVENTTLSYIDTGLCNIDYYYYVMAHHPDSLFESKSNTVDLEPKFIDFEIPISLSKTSVFRLNPSEFSPNNELIVTDWDYIYQSNLSFYSIDRWDNYFGWIENYALTSNPPFVDYNVKPPLQKYYYRVSYGDVCGNSGPQSNIGSNIILNGVNKENQFHLNWDSYSDWPGGIDSYTIQFFNSNFQAFTDIGVVSSDTYDYIDRELIEENRDSVFCFRVVASSFLNTNVKSNSNSLCLNPSPENFSPNAFTPNNDGINDFFEFYGSYPKSIRVKISNRWGQTVYESDQINFKWDGTNIQSGLNCPQDSYTVDFIIEGYDESVHKTRKSLTLIR